MSPKKPIESNDEPSMDPELSALLSNIDSVEQEGGGGSLKSDMAQGKVELKPQDITAPHAGGGIPTPAGMVSQTDFMTLISSLIDGLKGLQLTPEVLKEAMKEVGVANAEIARKARWPENTVHPHISAYSYPEGDIAHEKPTLVRETFFCGVEEKEERLTPGEIIAYNQISTPREARGGSWRAEIIKPKAMGGKEKLLVWVPKETVDQRMMLPSLALILHELNGGGSTEDVMSLIGQIETLKALLAKKGTTTQELEEALLK